jgi:hypothetical protein
MLIPQDVRGAKNLSGDLDRGIRRGRRLPVADHSKRGSVFADITLSDLQNCPFWLY